MNVNIIDTIFETIIMASIFVSFSNTVLTK